jgi:extradiol dioxygenase family protein
MPRPFHLAVPVDNLAKAAHFYGEVMQCEQGRSSDSWIDYSFFGHQFVVHLVDKMPEAIATNSVDNKAVPVPHFGVVLDSSTWHALSERLREHNIAFQLEPYIRFKGQTGEQGTFFIYDPAGNALEFKYFEDMTQLFAS